MKLKRKLDFMVARLIVLNIILFGISINKDVVKPIFTLDAYFNYDYVVTEQGVKIDSSYANLVLIFQSQDQKIIKLKYSEIYDIGLIYDGAVIDQDSYHDILVESRTGERADIYDLVYCKKDDLQIIGHQPFTNSNDTYFEIKSTNQNNSGIFKLPEPIKMEMLNECFLNKEIRFFIRGSLIKECEEEIFEIKSNWLKFL